MIAANKLFCCEEERLTGLFIKLNIKLFVVELLPLPVEIELKSTLFQSKPDNNPPNKVCKLAKLLCISKSVAPLAA